jgi:predicted FMN-binding regulatory protein PaiB
VRFCHISGVDGKFTLFFGITKDELLAICDRSDAEVAAWFESSPERKARVPEWNHIAVNLGRPGFPMAERLPIALATTYKHLSDQKFETVFQVLEADEKTD